MASCALHNFLIKTVPNSYSPPDCFDRENTEDGTTVSGFQTNNSNMESLNNRTQGNTTNDAKKVREDFINYFVNEGAVPWQNYFIN